MHQLPANYAVNLAAGADEATFERAVSKASSMGALVLAQYPAFGTFFVQSGSPTFAGDLGGQLSDAGISFHSVGPTRQAPVLGNEAVLPVETAGGPVVASGDAPAPAGQSPVRRRSPSTPSPASSASSWGRGPRASTSALTAA